MGTFRYAIEVGDPQGSRFEALAALVDTGASYTTVSVSLLRRLGVQPFERVPFIMADGRRIERDIGQTWVRIDGRQVITIVVFGEDGATPLLGAYTLEGLRLDVDATNERLVRTPGLLMFLSGVAPVSGDRPQMQTRQPLGEHHFRRCQHTTISWGFAARYRGFPTPL